MNKKIAFVLITWALPGVLRCGPYASGAWISEFGCYYARHQRQHASEKRIGQIMDLLTMYGAHAQRVTDRLEAVAHYFEHEEKDFPRQLSLGKANAVREAIKEISASTETPTLIYLQGQE